MKKFNIEVNFRRWTSVFYIFMLHFIPVEYLADALKLFYKCISRGYLENIGKSFSFIKNKKIKRYSVIETKKLHKSIIGLRKLHIVHWDWLLKTSIERAGLILWPCFVTFFLKLQMVIWTDAKLRTAHLVIDHCKAKIIN